jgi:hypothetical protein
MTILTCANIDLNQLRGLLKKYNLEIILINANKEIPGSWFGESEAGLIGNQLYIRMDTPVHSALHESCHYICMDDTRRKNLNTNAGGDYDEENGVCYLQILLADHIDNFGREHMFSDMNEWGYTFRLGSSKAWFNDDAEDAYQWLIKYNLINAKKDPLWNLRA